MLVVVSPEIRAEAGALVQLVERAFEGVDAGGVEVRVEVARKAREAFSGRAYPEPPQRPRSHPSTRYLVRLWVPRTLRNRGYPRSYRYIRRTTAPWITVGNWRERLLALAAHEAFHVRQFREGLRRSEVQAERWALRTLDRWRTGALASEAGALVDVPEQLVLWSS
jgi:hypothetical protein